MLAPTPPVPPKFWDIAMSYVCATISFNYNSVIGTSPYNMITKKHVIDKHLHAFWSKCWVYRTQAVKSVTPKHTKPGSLDMI